MNISDTIGLWEPSIAMRRCRIDVARAFGVNPWALVGPDRSERLWRARQAAAWVVKARWPKLSWCQLGYVIGVGDTSTVIHALRRASELRATDMTFHAATQMLAAQRPVPCAPLAEVPARPRVVKPRNDLQADDADARRRSSGTDRLLAALRREHPERFGRTLAGSSAATGERMMACG